MTLDIFLVEDNPGDVFLIEEALRESGQPFRLETAADGFTALERLSHCNGQPRCPDLILLDLNLPGLSGHQILEHIKKNARTRHLPVIILSSSQAPDDVRRAYDQYANGYVSKPCNLEELYAAVHQIQSFWRLAQLPTQKLPGL
jgi:two-component system, chemotaxis family, response regulator Rcp1